MTETEAIWTVRVQAWRDSGKSATEFVKGQSFAMSSLTGWARKLRKREVVETPTQPVSSPPESPAATFPMARVQRVRPSSSAHEMAVELGALRIVVRPGFDRALFLELMDALGARP